MADVRIMTDSVACIPADLAAEYGIKVVPAANIFINGDAYIDGQTITAEEAYEFIQNDPDRFVTSAITPELLLSEYQALLRETDNVAFITIASALTALNKTATLAAERCMQQNPGKTIKVYDSRTCASTQGLVVLAAVKAAKAGKSLDEVIGHAEAVRNCAGGLMILDTLRYVYRTGRMSKTASKIASIFNIRPINRITDSGTLEMVDRTRKRSEGLEKLIALINEEAGSQPLHFMVCHAAVPDMADEFSEELKKRFHCLSMVISDYSPVMGYGTGPGAIFVGFHPEIEIK